MNQDSPVRCCRCLRSKTMYFDPDERPGKLREDDDAAVYWCVTTQSPLGPDGVPATPTTCTPGRGCCRLH